MLYLYMLILNILFEALETKKNVLYDNSIYGRDFKNKNKKGEREMKNRKAVLR